MRALIFVAVYYAIFAYPWLRVSGQLDLRIFSGPLALAVLLCAPAVGWILSRRIEPPGRYWVARSVYVWSGVSWIAFALSVPWELVYLLTPIPTTTAASLWIVVLAILTAWAVFNGNRLTVRAVPVPLRGLERPIRAVQLSDVHVGSRSPAFLQRVVTRTAALDPDVVFITGDLVDGHGVSGQQLSALASLPSPVCFAIGNHERYVDCDAICARLESHGIIVLRNHTTEVLVADSRLTVTGIDDADDPAAIAKTLPSLPDAGRGCSVLLYHRPDGLEDAASHGIDLMLSGHTHNGQLVPFNALVRRRFPRIQGVYTSGSTVLHVSSGTGTWGPAMRLGSANEITLLELAPA
ncbi:MAG: metallophosphoesterase [Pseudomonadota bacterium]